MVLKKIEMRRLKPCGCIYILLRLLLKGKCMQNIVNLVKINFKYCNIYTDVMINGVIQYNVIYEHAIKFYIT